MANKRNITKRQWNYDRKTSNFLLYFLYKLNSRKYSEVTIWQTTVQGNLLVHLSSPMHRASRLRARKSASIRRITSFCSDAAHLMPFLQQTLPKTPLRNRNSFCYLLVFLHRKSRREDIPGETFPFSLRLRMKVYDCLQVFLIRCPSP